MMLTQRPTFGSCASRCISHLEVKVHDARLTDKSVCEQVRRWNQRAHDQNMKDRKIPTAVRQLAAVGAHVKIGMTILFAPAGRQPEYGVVADHCALRGLPALRLIFAELEAGRRLFRELCLE